MDVSIKPLRFSKVSLVKSLNLISSIFFVRIRERCQLTSRSATESSSSLKSYLFRSSEIRGRRELKRPLRSQSIHVFLHLVLSLSALTHVAFALASNFQDKVAYLLTTLFFKAPPSNF